MNYWKLLDSQWGICVVHLAEGTGDGRQRISQEEVAKDILRDVHISFDMKSIPLHSRQLDTRAMPMWESQN